MFKKIDKLILKAFLGPFVLTLAIVVFILMIIHISKYFHELVGKDLGGEVIAELFFYFALFNTPIALPLAVLLSSLMAFGSLGEHSELVAIKGSGISLTRVLRPVFIFVLLVTVAAFYNNNYVVPQAALNAYSLIYDIKQKKPALDIKPGTFYNGIPNYSIKVREKFPDGKTMKDLIIYDHSEGLGNKEVIMADSGLMYTILNDRYLKFELFKGKHYIEAATSKAKVFRHDQIPPFTRTYFDKSEMVFDLSSFDLKRTDKEFFAGDRLTRNFHELGQDIDSLRREVTRARYDILDNSRNYSFHLRNDLRVEIPDQFKSYKAEKDSMELLQVLEQIDVPSAAEDEKERFRARREAMFAHDERYEGIDTIFTAEQVTQMKEVMKLPRNHKGAVASALSVARSIRTRLTTQNTTLDYQENNLRRFRIQHNKMVAHAVACIVMFLIGAPVGAIIKKGGLGFPVILCITFFIIFYVIYITGENYAKEGKMDPTPGVWMSNLLLTPVGLFFLRQARRDARLFDMDSYYVTIGKLKIKLSRKKEVEATT